MGEQTNKQHKSRPKDIPLRKHHLSKDLDISEDHEDVGARSMHWESTSHRVQMSLDSLVSETGRCQMTKHYDGFHGPR